MLDNKSIIGIVWFDENDWEEQKTISEDQIEANYDNWLVEAFFTKILTRRSRIHS